MPETVVSTFNIVDITHPFYTTHEDDWFKWRLTYEGGEQFKNQYLKQFSNSEDKQDFIERRDISYVPAFAKVAIIEIRNSIYQRLTDIIRSGGSESYQQATKGEINGVDRLGSSMNTFIGTEVLEELLIMTRVGIYVDMPEKQGPLLSDNANIRPYLYMYKAEDIRSWDYHPNHEFKSLLLRECIYSYDETTGLPNDEIYRYRYYRMDDNGDIYVTFYNETSRPIFPDGRINGEPILLGIKRIPFVLLEINNSLLADVADYQIALMNLASTDMAYCFRSNFPFYTEQFDPRWESTHLNAQVVTTDDGQGGVVVNDVVTPPNQNVQLGQGRGRRYARNTDRPDFIAPPTAPIKASMEKQEQMKAEIRLLVNLSLANLAMKSASADSKMADNASLESGLSYIGLILEDGERQVAGIWHEYENNSANYIIKYPEKYSLRNDKDVRDEVIFLKVQMSSVPSIIFKRVLAKRIVDLLIGNKIPFDQLMNIYREIDSAEVIDVLVDKIEKDVAAGYLDPKLAAKLRGYPESTVDKAQQFRAQRIKEIQAAQTNPNNGFNPAARGNPDLSPDPALHTSLEKDAAGNPVRGPASGGTSSQ
jgi:hypothetical protein